MEEVYQDTKISNILGLSVKIQLINNEEIIGQIYSFIKENNILIIIQKNTNKSNNDNTINENNSNKTNTIETKGHSNTNNNDKTNELTHNMYGIKTSKIKNMIKLDTKDSDYNQKPPYLVGLNLNLQKLVEKERMNIEKKVLLKRSDKSNLLYKTYLKGYAIYDKLSKIFNLRFTGTNIKFDELDAQIDVPFNIKDIHCLNEKTKNHLTKLIQDCIKEIK